MQCRLHHCTTATCGDGQLNATAGEECDDAAESETCNSDCSAAACGDGQVNTAAGEDCDDTGESALCDDDCTTPECGDGQLNATAGEACDDGNVDDTDACPSTCVEATCGDGYIQMGVEGCDEGMNNSDMGACLSDCQTATCGDGFVQDTMEECDGEDPDNASCAMCLGLCDEGYGDCNMDMGLDGCETQLCGGTCDEPGQPTGTMTFEYTGSIEEFVVPLCAETLTIEAWGAQGGDNIELDGDGGLGARMLGEFEVTPGETIEIIVGQRGIDATQGNAANGAGGGGGGSFVWIDGALEPLLVAGGGGGSSLTNTGLPHYLGKPGVITENGSGSRSDDENNDAPGGTAGADGQAVSGSGGLGWTSVMLNPEGVPACNYGGTGGYGGGGGSGCGANICNSIHTAGGGGGYSGGGAGGNCYYFGGGGGGSFNVGANPDNAEGIQEGDGQVVISW